MSTDFREDLNIRLKEPKFAMEFGSEVAKTDFAVTLAKTRRDKLVTQAELARRLGVKQSYIAKLERGDTNPTLGIAGKILAALGVRLRTDVAPLTAESSLTTEQRFIPYFSYGISKRKSISIVRKYKLNAGILHKDLVLR